MAGAKITLTGNWHSFQKAIDPKEFRARLEPRLLQAGQRVGMQWQARARRLIRKGAYAPNSPITVILKGSSRPLVADGDLFDSLTYDQPSPYTLRMGVVRGRRGGNDEIANVGFILHEGAVLDVDLHSHAARKVWSMVSRRLQSVATGTANLTKASKKSVLSAAGALGSGGGKANGVWVTPGRPFITKPMEGNFGAYARKTYAEAVEVALKGPPKKTQTEKA